MIERFVDLGPLTDAVSGSVVAWVVSASLAIVSAAGGVTYVAGELWTEEKVREGVAEHSRFVAPRLESIEERAAGVQRRQAEFRRDIDVILEKLNGIDQRNERTERMVETLLTRELRRSGTE